MSGLNFVLLGFIITYKIKLTLICKIAFSLDFFLMIRFAFNFKVIFSELTFL